MLSAVSEKSHSRDPHIEQDQTVIVGMSGGVDSSVAALMLIEAGYQVEGLFMKNWEEDDGTEYCTAKEDLADAQSVADQLGSASIAPISRQNTGTASSTTSCRSTARRTPNPDILCNREIKFAPFSTTPRSWAPT